MTDLQRRAKEKAEELMERFFQIDIEIGGQYDGYLTMKKHEAKDCAKIAVNEIIDKDGFNNDYWKEVLKQIEQI